MQGRSTISSSEGVEYGPFRKQRMYMFIELGILVVQGCPQVSGTPTHPRIHKPKVEAVKAFLPFENHIVCTSEAVSINHSQNKCRWPLSFIPTDDHRMVPPVFENRIFNDRFPFYSIKKLMIHRCIRDEALQFHYHNLHGVSRRSGSISRATLCFLSASKQAKDITGLILLCPILSYAALNCPALVGSTDTCYCQNCHRSEQD